MKSLDLKLPMTKDNFQILQNIVSNLYGKISHLEEHIAKLNAQAECRRDEIDIITQHLDKAS